VTQGLDLRLKQNRATHQGIASTGDKSQWHPLTGSWAPNPSISRRGIAGGECARSEPPEEAF